MVYCSPYPFPLTVLYWAKLSSLETPSKSECGTETPVAAAALTPGLLKHGKEVYTAGGGPGLHQHRRITPFVRVATLGIGLVLQGGSISERRRNNPS